MLALDCETYPIAPGRLAPRLVCLSSWDGAHGELLARDDAVDFAVEVLEGDSIIAGHNIAYDWAVLVAAGVPHELVWRAYDAGRIHDTMLVEQLAHIEKYGSDVPRFSLAGLVKKYARVELEGKYESDAWRFRYQELEAVAVEDYPEAAARYALLDSWWTWKIADVQERQENAAAQAISAYALHLMSCWGLVTDPEAIAALAARLEANVQSCTVSLKDAGLLRASGSKDLKTIRARVSASFEGEPPQTDKGAVSTSRDTLERSGDPLLESLASISADQKLINTYLPVLRAGTERPINAGYGLVASGRTSAFRPNIQNQPRRGGVRECFRPRPGWLYVQADYHLAELCSLAQVCLDWFGHSVMADYINRGEDLHLVTGEAIARSNGEPGKARDYRQMAKALSFGLPGGLGPATFCDFARAAYGLTIEIEQAKELKRVWLSTFPEMVLFFRRISKEISGGRVRVTQVRSNRVRGDCSYTSACNSYFQGLTADGARAAVTEVVRQCYFPGSPLFGCRAVCFIHDELILEAPAAIAAGAAKELEKVMVRQMRRYTPDVLCRATPLLMDRWWKGAEPLYDASGALLVYCGEGNDGRPPETFACD